MICPFCDCDNLAGVEQCARCHADLTNLDDPSSAADIERDLLHRPLGELAVRDCVEVSPDTLVREIIRQLNEGGYHCAIVTSDGQIVGIFTERDILNKIADRFDEHAEEPVIYHMTANVETLGRDDPVAFALNRMMVGGFRHIPIVDHGKPAGVVSVRDILAYLVDHFGELVTTSPPCQGGGGGG